MHQLLKMFWRWDFEPSYAYLDRRGSALRALNKSAPTLFAEVGEGVMPNSFVARNDSHPAKFSGQLSAELNSINGSFEWPVGTKLETLASSKHVRDLDRVLKDLWDVYALDRFARAGIRFVCISSKTSEAFSMQRSPLAKFATQNFAAKFRSRFGEASDIGLTIEGSTDAEVKYRIQFGPYAEKNVKQNVPNVEPEVLRSYSEYDLFIDMDFYENGISSTEQSLIKWSSTKIQMAIGFLELCSQIEA